MVLSAEEWVYVIVSKPCINHQPSSVANSCVPYLAHDAPMYCWVFFSKMNVSEGTVELHLNNIDICSTLVVCGLYNLCNLYCIVLVCMCMFSLSCTYLHPLVFLQCCAL